MLTFIPTPIGNPQDITIRALKEFEKARLFLCEDTRETKRLLRILEERFDFIYPDVEFLSFHEHNGEARLLEISERLSSEEVVYVSDAGMPIISDPGQILVEYCQKYGIKYDVLPGASAVVTAYAASGFKEGAFLFFGFLPHKGSQREEQLITLMNGTDNVVLYEAPHRIEKLIESIVKLDETREIFCAKEISKRFQTYHKGMAKDILERFKTANLKGEWVVVIEAKKQENRLLCVDDILTFDLQPKIKAKLLAKMTNKSVKEWYEELINS